MRQHPERHARKRNCSSCGGNREATPKQSDRKEGTNDRKRRAAQADFRRGNSSGPWEREPQRKKAEPDDRRLSKKPAGAHIARPNLFSSIESPVRALLDTLHETASELLQLSRRAEAGVKDFPASAGGAAGDAASVAVCSRGGARAGPLRCPSDADAGYPAGSCAATAMRRRMVAPPPSRFSALSSPRCSRTARSAIAKPTPKPPVSGLRASSTR